MLLKFVKLFIVLLLLLFIGLAVYVMFFDITPNYVEVEKPLTLESETQASESETNESGENS